MSTQRGSHRLLWALSLGLLLGGASAQPAAAADAENARLTTLMLQGYDRSRDVLAELRAHPLTGVSGIDALWLEGQVLADGGQIDAAQRLAERLTAMPEGRGASELLLAHIAERRGLSVDARAAAQRAWALMASRCALSADGSGVAKGCPLYTAWMALRLRQRAQEAEGALADAAASAKHALAIADALGDRRLRALGLASLALLSQQLDEPAQARRWLAEALNLAEGDPLVLARLKLYEAMISIRRGDAAAQLRSYDEALAAAREANSPRMAANIQTNLVDVHMHAGRPAQALALANAALPAVLAFQDLRLERTLRHNMAVALLMQKQFDAARRELARSQALGESQQEPARRAVELREVGEAWAAAGQAREAVAVFHAERALTAQTQARNRETQLQALSLKFDSEREQRNLELLKREQTLKDQQLENRDLARQVGVAVGVLLSLSLLLVGLMLKRVHQTNRKLKDNQKLLRAQSERDPLTDLANRRYFLAVMQAHAKESFGGALMMVDIDHFKHVNDRHGHGAGDAVICEVGRRISAAVRHEDLVVRWGGEEFLVFASAVTPDQLRLLAERILFSVGGTTVPTEAGDLRITVSIGFASFPLSPCELPLHWERAVDWADMALYTAKAQGRNRAVGIGSVQAPDGEALKQIESNFDEACASRQVSLLHIVGPA